MLRWGILGTTTGAAAVAAALRAAGHDLAVVASPALTQAQQFAASSGVRRARGMYGEVLDARDVDAVYVALPPDERESWAIAALMAGRHVLCAPPLAPDAAAAGRVAAAAAASGCLVMEAAVARFHPRTDALFELVHGGAVGPVRLVSVAARVLSPTVAFARWLAGEEPDAVVAVSRAGGTTAGILGFPAGTVAAVAALGSVAHEALEVVGVSGTLRVPQPFTHGRDEPATILRDGAAVGRWSADARERMVTAFAGAVTDGRPAPLPPDDAVATATVVDAVRAAASAR